MGSHIYGYTLQELNFPFEVTAVSGSSEGCHPHPGTKSSIIVQPLQPCTRQIRLLFRGGVVLHQTEDVAFRILELGEPADTRDGGFVVDHGPAAVPHLFES